MALGELSEPLSRYGAEGNGTERNGTELRSKIRLYVRAELVATNCVASYLKEGRGDFCIKL